jgi:CRP/FNR family transcriptional regulator, cyclic AMP receptor protein
MGSVHGSGFWWLLSEADREALTADARPRTFRPGTELCHEGDLTTHVFVLLSGWVKVCTDSWDGREVVEAVRGGGDVIGEMAGELTGYRTATVRALEKVTALTVSAAQFGAYLDSRSSAGRAYRRAMAERQRAANQQRRDRGLLDGPQLLACLLLDLAEQRRAADGDSAQATLPLSQEELGSLIGMSRATVTRALSGWRSRGIVSTGPRRIQILDGARLRQISGRPAQGRLAGRYPAAESGSSSRMRFMNDDHSSGENLKTTPERWRESRISTDRSSLAISTQSLPV